MIESVPMLSFEPAGLLPASEKVQRTIFDTGNIKEIIGTSSKATAALAQQMRMLVYNLNAAENACSKTSGALNSITVGFERAIDPAKLTIDMQAQINHDKQRIQTIKAAIDQYGTQLVNDPQLYSQIKKYLDEIRSVENNQKIIAIGIKNMRQDLDTIASMQKTRNKNIGQVFNPADHLTIVSNASIVEMYDLELQKHTALYNSWKLYFPEFQSVFSDWADFKRSDNKKLFITQKPGATEFSLSNLGANYLLDKNDIAVKSLEQRLAEVLNNFWALNSGDLEKLTAECFKKYRPPFGFIKNLPSNVFMKSLTYACERDGTNGASRIKLLLSQEMGNGSDSPLPITSLVSSNYKVDFGLAAGGLPQIDISRVCGQSAFAAPTDQIYGTIYPAGNCCRGRRAFGNDWLNDDDDNGEMEEGAGDMDEMDLYSNLYAGAAPKVYIATQAYPSKRKSSSRHVATYVSKRARTEPMSMDGAPADYKLTASINDMYNAIVSSIATCTSLLNYSVEGFPKIISNVISMMDALGDMQSFQCLTRRAASQLYVSVGEIAELIATYDYNITHNDDLGEVYRLNKAQTIGLLKQALKSIPPIETRPATPNGAYVLPRDMWYTTHREILRAYNACNNQVYSVLTNRMASASLYVNKLTIGNIGILNQDSSKFFIEPSSNGKLIKFKTPDAGLEAAFDKFKADLALDQLNFKLGTLKRSREAITLSVDMMNAAYNQCQTLLNDALAEDQRSGAPRFGNAFSHILDSIMTTRSFCAHYERPNDSSLYAAYLNDLKSNPNLSYIEYFSKLTNDQIKSELYGGVSSIGCLLNRATSSGEKKNATRDYPPAKKILEGFLILFTGLLKIRALPTENYKLENGVFSPVYDLIDKQIADLNKQIADWSAVHLAVLEKKFSTPIIRENETIVDLLLKYGYKLMLMQPETITILMMGPSGSGKSYKQYGTRDVKGIDSVLLNLPGIHTTRFSDRYHLSFGFQESYVQSAREPIIWNYNITADGKVTSVLGGPIIDIKRDKLQSEYYNTQIKPRRIAAKLIRPTVNNPESSRSFFVASVDITDGDVKHTKNMVDSPGSEIIPPENIAYTNPFLHIFYYLVKIIPAMSPQSMNLGELLPDPSLANRIGAEVSKWREGAHNNLLREFGGMGLTKEALDRVESERVPLPPGVNWADSGIVDCQFSDFIRSAYLPCPVIRSISRGGIYSLMLSVVNNQMELWDTASNLFYVVPDNVSVSTDKFRSSTNQTQNLVVDKQLAYVIMWTWAVYKAVLQQGRLAPSATNNVPSANNMAESYSGRVKRLIEVVSKAYPNSADAESAMTLTCEATIINQFNKWVALSTNKSQASTIDKFITDTSSTQQFTRATENRAFYEFMLAVSDIRFSANDNKTIDRFRFNKVVGYEFEFFLGDLNQFSASLNKPPRPVIGSYHELQANLGRIMSAINQEYALYNKAFFLPERMDRSMETFNSFMGKSSRNLFFYVLNALKAPNYFPFFDISQEGISAAINAQRGVPPPALPPAPGVPPPPLVPGPPSGGPIPKIERIPRLHQD